MDKIGISLEEIDEILKEALAPEKIVDCNALRQVIATAIIRNNEQLLADIKKLFPTT